jgi:hypothetical protein
MIFGKTVFLAIASLGLLAPVSCHILGLVYLLAYINPGPWCTHPQGRRER